MHFTLFNQFLINQFESILEFSQISIRIRISFGHLILQSYVSYVNDTHEIQFCSANFLSNFFLRIRIRIMIWIRVLPWNSITKSSALYIKDTYWIWCRSTKFCQNQNPAQDQNQGRDFILDFYTGSTFFTHQTPTKFCLDPLIPSKFIVSKARIHVRMSRHADRQTDGRKCGRTDRQTDGQIEIRTDGWADRQTERQPYRLLLMIV